MGMHSKTKEVASLTKMIETKMGRVGELGVEIANMEADAGDTADALAEDKKLGQDLEGTLETSKGEHKATLKALMGVDKYITDLHGECDWLLKYFDVRAEARTNEIESLKKAKDVLNGADYSL